MIGFFVASPFDISTNLIADLKKYLDPSFQLLVSFEKHPSAHKEFDGQHYHFCVKGMSDKQYDSFRKTILVNKLHLRGQARQGNPRQYGRIKNIRDETKLLIYTTKDKNIYSENIDLKTIQEYIQKSYPKVQPKDFVLDIMQFLSDQEVNYPLSDDVTSENGDPPQYLCIEKSILRYYIQNKINKPVSKSTLRSLTTRYLMYYRPNTSINHIYAYISG